MKKVYEAPVVEIEYYQLDTSIASNCAIPVSNGPGLAEYHDRCDDYVEPFSTFSARSLPSNVQFYEENCDCYTTGGDYGYWTS